LHINETPFCPAEQKGATGIVTRHYQMLIDGAWTDGTGQERLDSHNPFD